MAGLDDIREMAEGAIAGINPDDVAAGAELAAEAAAGVVSKVSADIASITPEDLSAGADLIQEAIADAAQKAAN